MEPVASISLPPGLVRTASEIFDEVASYPILPSEKIREYWNAYATGFRMMVDPTAARLENFWWHVWGSDRRYLPGPVLARLFKELALGPTFVPLARYSKPPLTRKATSDQSHGQQQKSGPSSPKSPEEHASSSSKAPQAPRPILKKNRGPSASGPRPTARFVDPPAPDDGNVGDRNTSARTTAAHQQAPSSKSQEQENAETQPTKPQDIPTLSTFKAEPGVSNEMPPPPKPASKRRTSSTSVTGEAPRKDMRQPRQTSPAGGTKAALPTGRKIVVPTAATRRRPMMPRRQSSQSSTGSPTVRLVGPVGAALKQAKTRRPSTDSKGSQEAVVAEPSESGESNLSAKAAGKRPVREPSQKNTPKTPSPSRDPSRAGNTQDKAVQTNDQLSGAGVLSQALGGGSANGENLPETQTLQRPPPMAAFMPKHPPGTPLKDRIRSHIDLMSSTSAAGVTTTHASGRIGSDTLIYPDTLPEAHDLPDSVKYAKPALPSVLEPKFKPTPRNPAPPIPYGRSKSELFLLLEKINGNSGKDSASSRPPI
ncbi:hypothetical protein QBC43DRAFT_215181 [Cladorrhinum sp. PSN259]|nr:hypothetical protein QBC43DRAFT_215181 [Cladorrhinum sp. PSN259]